MNCWWTYDIFSYTWSTQSLLWGSITLVTINIADSNTHRFHDTSSVIMIMEIASCTRDWQVWILSVTNAYQWWSNEDRNICSCLIHWSIKISIATYSNKSYPGFHIEDLHITYISWRLILGPSAYKGDVLAPSKSLSPKLLYRWPNIFYELIFQTWNN